MTENKGYIPDDKENAKKNDPQTISNKRSKETFKRSSSVTENPEEIPEKCASTNELVQLKRQLGLWNGVGMIVGIMIGSGIFVSPGNVVRYSGSVGMSLMVWVGTGLLSMTGALCYAELGTMIPKSGGSYIYIYEALGSVPAFLTMWINMIILSPASRAIGLITFATYFLQPIFPDCPSPPYLAVRLLALTMLGFATYINCAGVKLGTRLQDSLTVTKVLALILIIAVGIHHVATGHVENFRDPMQGTIVEVSSIATAFYASSFAYGGWNSLNALMEELKDPYKNLPLAIAISLTCVTLIYTLTNAAYFAVLTPAEIMASSAVAVTFGSRTLGVMAWIISFFVACSTFGNLNGGLIAQSRTVYAAAREGHFPQCLALIHVNNYTPITSVISVVMFPAIMVFVPDVGSLLTYTAFAGSLTSVLSVSSLLWLRYKEPEKPRPIKVWIGIPIFYMVLLVLLAALPVMKRPIEIGAAVCIIIIGLVVYYFAIYKKIKVIGDLMDKVTYVCQMLFQCVEEEKIE